MVDEESGVLWGEDDNGEVLISALEHYSYCPRQCALIHLEQTYDENEYTMRGKLAHEKAHQEGEECEGDRRIVRSMALWSHRLGLRGRADVVEFGPDGPYPVEYKVGRRRGVHAELQLCAQAMCLEEMLNTPVPKGAVFYRGARRRQEVHFDTALRKRVVQVAEEVRLMLASGRLPEAPNDARCRHCSLKSACLPQVTSERALIRGLQGALFRPLTASPRHLEGLGGHRSGGLE